jgi:hypothetical protein
MQNVTAGTGTAGAGAVANDETDRLIASNKVEGTAVYNRQGERLGEVYNFMVDKRSGQAAYAVMSFGGFLGMGGGHHPLPWKALAYDTSLGGYVVDIDKDRLRGAPGYAADETPALGRPGLRAPDRRPLLPPRHVTSPGRRSRRGRRRRGRGRPSPGVRTGTPARPGVGHRPDRRREWPLA